MLDKGQMKGADVGEAIAAAVGSGGGRQPGKRAVLAREIADWMRPRQRFHKADLRAAIESSVGPVPDCEFGPALNRARDALRAEGVEYAPVPGEPGVLAWADDPHTAKRAIKFATGARRKYRRSAAIAACVSQPERLPDVQRRSFDGARERLAIMQAAAKRRKRLPGVD